METITIPVRIPREVVAHAMQRSDHLDRIIELWYRPEDKTWLTTYDGHKPPRSVWMAQVDSEDVLERLPHQSRRMG